MTLEELYNDLSEKAGKACTAMNDGAPQKDITALKQAARKAETAYNAEAARQKFLAWADAGDPLEEAIRERYVDTGKKAYYKTTDTGRFFVEINDYKFKCDLIHLRDTLGIERFHETNWFTKVQKLALLLANALNENLSKNPQFRYAVDEAAETFEFADGADLSSNASILKALQQTVDSILFLPTKNKKSEEVNRIKVIQPAWVFIAQSMTRQGADPGHVAISGTGKMTELVVDAMHCLLTGKKFKLISA